MKLHYFLTIFIALSAYMKPELFNHNDPPCNYYVYALTRKNTHNPFTIHGLWCQYDEHHWPEYCTKDQFNLTKLEPLQDKLNKYWISDEESNEDFWKHEWEKHGTCTTMDEFQFFNKTLLLYDTLLKDGLNKTCDFSSTECKLTVNKNFNFVSEALNER